MTASTAVTHRQHRVDFYDSDAEIVASVVRFLRPAMAEGVALVVAAPEHRNEIRAALWPALRGRSDGSTSRLVIVDAEQTLGRFMIDGVPDADAFHRVIGDLLHAAAEVDGPVRVFGEMVALLWRQGNVTAALAVEELWNELAQQRAFSLLCGYPSALFTDADVRTFDEVCAQHTSVSVSPHSQLASRAHVSRRTTPDDVVERWHFPRDLASGAQVRRRLRALLRTWQMDVVLDDAALLTTELVNNAILHTGSPVSVSVRRLGTAALRIEVTDVGGGFPRRLNRDVMATHGRGLLMVESMSSAWGAAVHGGAKTIWFELGEPSAS